MNKHKFSSKYFTIIASLTNNYDHIDTKKIKLNFFWKSKEIIEIMTLAGLFFCLYEKGGSTIIFFGFVKRIRRIFHNGN